MIMKDKTGIAIYKFINTTVYPWQVCYYYNVYFTKSIFYGSYVIIIEKNNKELRIMHKESILRKLGILVNYLRSFVHARKNALSLRLVALRMIIVIKSVKLYLANKRFDRIIVETIKMCKEYFFVQHIFKLNITRPIMTIASNCNSNTVSFLLNYNHT